MRSARFGRSSGSPPVMRIFLTPARTNTRASRRISAKSSRSLALQEAVRLVKGLARHAVRATEIAAVHDRDAQVVDRPPQGVQRRAAAPLTRAASGTTFSRGSMVLATHQRKKRATNPFGKRVGSRRQLDEAIGAGERGEIAGAIGRAGFGRGAAPVVGLQLHRQVEGERPPSPRRARSARSAARSFGAWPIAARSAGST